MQLETRNAKTFDTTDLELARALLYATKGATAVAVRGDEVLISQERGVKPLLGWIAEGKSLAGFSVADKVVGKAPALLYAILGPAAVFAPVMTNAARAVLLANEIACGNDTLVEKITNRAGDGQCPMDATVTNVFDPYEAESAIRARLSQMTGVAA